MATNFFSYGVPVDDTAEYSMFEDAARFNPADHGQPPHPSMPAGSNDDEAKTNRHTSMMLYPPTKPVASHGSLETQELLGSSFRRANIKVETPPDLSSGSSTTPDSLSSQQATTPKTEGAPTTVSQHTRAQRAAPAFSSRRGTSSSRPRPPGRKKAAEKAPATRDEVRGEDEEDGEDDDEDLDGDEEESSPKRVRFLERNRVAATKCRQKKKEWVSDLEGTKGSLESQNRALRAEYDRLLDEATRVREQLVNHASCGDANIEGWVGNEAKRFVVESAERYDQILVGMGRDPSMIAAQYGDFVRTQGYANMVPELDAMSPDTAHPAHRSGLSLQPPPPLPPGFPPHMAPVAPPPPAVMEDHFSHMAQPAISPMDAPGVHPAISPTDAAGVHPAISPIDAAGVHPAISPIDAAGAHPAHGGGFPALGDGQPDGGFDPHGIAMNPGY